MEHLRRTAFIFNGCREWKESRSQGLSKDTDRAVFFQKVLKAYLSDVNTWNKAKSWVMENFHVALAVCFYMGSGGTALVKMVTGMCYGLNCVSSKNIC